MNSLIVVNNARIEEIVTDRGIGFTTISYEEKGDFHMIHVRVVTLVVSPSTRIQDHRGRRILFRDLKEGMIVNAEFSSAMTRSIPPQTRAFLITVVKEHRDTNVTVDRVVSIDTRQNFLYTGDPRNISRQMRFVITRDTVIRDRRGNRINLGSLRRGETVRVEHATFQTASIPPQTTAFSVQII